MSQPALPTPKRFVVTGRGILSSIGIGNEAFASALHAGRTGRKPVDGLFEEPLPGHEACYISDFEPREFLGKKGIAFLDRLTALTIVACGMALEDAGLTMTEQNQNRVGIVLGSGMGSQQSISNFTRDTLIHSRPYLVNPVLFPNTVMNCAAGRSAIWHSLKGVNSTVSGGQLSSLTALRYAMTVIRQGYADVLLTGGAEEFSPQMAWGFHHAGSLKNTDTLLGEGCAMFVIEEATFARNAGRTPLLEILACRASTCAEPGPNPEATTKGLATCIRQALQQAGVTPNQIWALADSARGDRVLDSVEEEGICQALGNAPAHRLKVKQVLGECYSAAGALQLAALVALYKTTPGAAGRVSLLTSVGRDGSVGCAIVREEQV
jgi:3-oxoacyl-[acyl-carrier-protein] synthase II